MDKRSPPFNAHNETPPPKKRRLHPPGFESSFHMNASPSKPPRRTTTIQSSLLTTAHQFTSMFVNGGREQGGPPTRGLKSPRLPLHDYASEVYAASEDGNSPAHHGKKRVSASFSKFTSTFDMPLPPTASKPRSELPPSKMDPYPHQISTLNLLRTRTVETGSVGATAVAHQTPMNVLKPPLLREAVEPQKYCLPMNHAPPPARVSHPLGITSIPDADKLQLTSMMSHLTSLKGAVSHLASPKRTATEVNRKLVPIAPPTLLPPESPKGLNEAATTATPSSVSHAERAEILANSVRVSRTQQPVNIELAELSRGFELSPQKGGRAHGKKLIKGGLAERAEHLLFRSSANFSLWQAGFTKQLEGAKHTKEDIRLRILSILSSTKNTTRSFSDGLPRTSIAKCMEVFQGAPEGNEGSSQEKTVVFLFANHERVSSPINFKEGKEVCIWRPWREIELPEVFDQLHQPTLEGRAPLTPGGSTTSRKTALLCSRFLVLV